MEGGDTNEKDDDRVELSGSDVRGRYFIGSGSNQEPLQGSNKNHLSNRNPGSDSHPEPAKEPEQGTDPNQRSGKRRLWEDYEITTPKISGKKG
jgi:hypothetical protein